LLRICEDLLNPGMTHFTHNTRWQHKTSFSNRETNMTTATTICVCACACMYVCMYVCMSLTWRLEIFRQTEAEIS